MRRLLLTALGLLCLGVPATWAQQALDPGAAAIVCAYNSSPPAVASGGFIFAQCDTNRQADHLRRWGWRRLGHPRHVPLGRQHNPVRRHQPLHRNRRRWRRHPPGHRLLRQFGYPNRNLTRRRRNPHRQPRYNRNCCHRTLTKPRSSRLAALRSKLAAPSATPHSE
jgi:hypothetical protein